MNDRTKLLESQIEWMRTKLADRERRIRLARRELVDSRMIYTVRMESLLDLRKPLPAARRKRK